MRQRYDIYKPGTTQRIGKITFDDEHGVAGLELDELEVGGEAVPGEQRVRLLGPFNVTFETALENVSGSITFPFHVLTSDLPVNATIVRVAALTTIPWERESGDDPIVLEAALTDFANAGPQAIRIYGDRVDENWASGAFPFMVAQAETEADAWTINPTAMARILAPSKLVCVRRDNAGAVVAGSTDFYVLIAEPME